jgi:hypothetical protein
MQIHRTGGAGFVRLQPRELAGTPHPAAYSGIVPFPTQGVYLHLHLQSQSYLKAELTILKAAENSLKIHQIFDRDSMTFDDFKDKITPAVCT